METTLFLAKVMSAVFAPLGLAMLLNSKHFKAIIDDFVKSPGLIYVTAFFMTAMGALMVCSHNVWEGGALPILVTLFSWMLFVKGLAYLVFPKQVVSWVKKFKSSSSLYLVGGLVAILVGAYLWYAAALV